MGVAMKKLLLLAASAVAIVGMASGGQAADLPLKAPPMMSPPPFSWTGFYIGGNIGAAWADGNVTDNLTGQTFSRSSDAVFIGGGQIGFNYQISALVLGAEWDFDAAGSNDSRVGAGGVVPGVGTFAVSGGGNRWLTTVAGRVGFAVDRWMFYLKGGWGEVGVRNLTVTNTANGVFVTGGSRSLGGGMLGAGFEYAFTNNFTIKAEYNYIALSNRDFVIPAAPNLPAGFGAGLAGNVFRSDSNVQAVKVGFNYLFGRGGF